METKGIEIFFRDTKEWLAKSKRPFIISGPCSAETQEQMLATAMQLSETGVVDVIRAGVWKPRTRPGSFEGVGEKALNWLQEVKSVTGLPVTVEVANASHVEKCLEAGIDILWIGARTTVNPFFIQEIADALKGVDIPVLIKNPVNPDLALWIGGVERLLAVGVKSVGAIHRGFSYYGEKVYRNKPQWQITIDFRREMPNIPLLCDPSHICGNRSLLLDVSQRAMDLDFDGLMIESHIDPEMALSDAKQQVPPSRVKEIVSSLVLRHDKEDDLLIQSELDKLRQGIDEIDEEILHMFSSRLGIVREIARYKIEHNITIFQQKRWNFIIGKAKGFAHEHGLSENFIESYLKSLHEESINEQTRLMREFTSR